MASKVRVELSSGLYEADSDIVCAVVDHLADANLPTIRNLVSVKVYGDDSHREHYTQFNRFELCMIIADASPNGYYP